MFVGIDLAASQARPTAICALKALRKGFSAYFALRKTDAEIVQIVAACKPKLVGVDAPLSKPKRGVLRKEERQLQKLGIKFFPLGLPGMVRLTQRGIRLKRAFAKLNIKVLEVFPGAVLQLAGVRRKDVQGIKSFLEKVGIAAKTQSTDLLHAAIAAWTCAKHAARQSYLIGRIVMPKLDAKNP